ncbi:MAG TPA: carbohydrate porin [Chthoniobacterales bacterium]
MDFRISRISLLALGCAAIGTADAAKLPPHVTDQPVNRTRMPIREIGTTVERQIDAGFTALEHHSFDPFANYWGTWLTNPVGGRERGSSWAQLLVFGGEYHFDHLGWQGGSVFASATDFAGFNLSEKVGNVFTLSQAVVSDTFALYSLYLRQQFSDGRIDLRIGRMSAGEFFATLPIMGLPVGGAVNGNPTSLFTNAPFHATGSASWGAFVKGMPTAATYLQAGIFQASPQTGVPANHGVNFAIERGDGELLMLEAGWLPTFAAPDTTSPTPPDKKTVAAADPSLPGHYSFGGYYANYTFPTFTGGVAHNAFGFYTQGQQMVWRSTANPDHNLTVWSGLTFSPQEEFALLPLMAYGGIAWQGLIPGRDRDTALLNAYLGGFSRDYARQQAAAGAGFSTLETVFEASYIVQLTQNLQFQPDVQWVIQPGGTRSIPNALVVGFQVSALF